MAATEANVTVQVESDPKTGISNYFWMTEDEVSANIFIETKTGKVTNYQVLDRRRKSEADKKLSEEPKWLFAKSSMAFLFRRIARWSMSPQKQEK
ncbi:hypothetical protein [Brevibacillus porteri]|uniref:hypothetical protein n=1 Tax=Brevibacillus porteri TaxID=2126350 RepID=UPI003D1D96F0